MGKIKKKGEAGAATNYITRSLAVKKLQVSLADFRRLCILKGIYPREPKNKKKANKGSTKPTTFYYTKDIQYLLHEPLLQKFREHKVFVRKLAKAAVRKEYSIARSLRENKPTYTLDHIVKERYPSFIDALRDLDDALCMIFLFATMPQTDKVKSELIEDCQRLSAEFQHYVIRARALRKTFLSIKGIYYQAEIHGQPITWVVPYQFSQAVPSDVDFRVMLTFLEFYRTLVGFVNFRLFSDLKLVYPPRQDTSLANGAAGLDAWVVEKSDDFSEEGEKPADDGEEAMVGSVEDKIFEKPTEEMRGFTLEDIKQAHIEEREHQRLFAGCVIYLSREVPRYSLEFIVRAFGGNVGWDPVLGAGSPYMESDARITHQVCDRPDAGKQHLTRNYVQPQWVYDCVNAKKLLRTQPYGPGQTLPPHLSPFVEVKEGDYVPKEAIDGFEPENKTNDDDVRGDDKQIDGEMGIENEDDEDDEGNEEEFEEEEEEEEDEEDVYQKELEAEAAGISYSDYVEQSAGARKRKSKTEVQENENKKAKKSRITTVQSEEKEVHELAKIMMTRKQQKLYNKIEYGRKRKEAEVAKLQNRKQELLAKEKEEDVKQRKAGKTLQKVEKKLKGNTVNETPVKAPTSTPAKAPSKKTPRSSKKHP
ncbi:uncharacterized protein VTP21DRAFT_7803 [Calcarisporiella thermophila]|uniref:uncharacterized protein n=1 Tax=Calcarisporiella thermophila TaxID=911321 RepID=UPI0037445CAA